MKIDKRRPSHWFFLALFGLNVLVARLWRRLMRPRPGTVVFYGHKLNGNLLPVFDLVRLSAIGLRPSFLSMDPGYCRELRRKGVPVVLAWSPACAKLLAEASAIVSDHGLHVMEWLLGARHLKFFDVWHGIPFKGFDARDFRVQRRYDEVWVSSPRIKQMYVDRFGFDANRVFATGYARTDILACEGRLDRAHMIELLGLQRFSRRVLFAPTWQQDDTRRNIYPFGLDECAFLSALGDVCSKHGAVLLVRKHLNSGRGEESFRESVRFISSSDHPDTEAILAISDVLVCDWSSIAFDFLVLDRPTIFLDVPPPFAKGFALGPENRFGDVVPDIDALLRVLDDRLAAPANYAVQHAADHERVRALVYADLADGHATERCADRLQRAVFSGESSR